MYGRLSLPPRRSSGMLVAYGGCDPIFRRYVRRQIGNSFVEFKSAYSTSVFPSVLKGIFRTPPERAAVATAAGVKKPRNNSKKARSTAKLIDENPWSESLESALSGDLLPLSQTGFFQTIRRIRTPAKALRFFDWATNSGFAHSTHSYFRMIEILGKARHLNAARNFLLAIPRKTTDNNGAGVRLTDKLFNSLIRSYAGAGLFRESIKLFKLMKSYGISPSAFTFNTLFTILFGRGRLGMALQLFDEMLGTYGVKPDLCTFNVLIKGFCANSTTDTAFRMFNKMSVYNCEPDLITYNTLVNGLCRAGKVDIARNLVAGMRRKDPKLRPNVVTYTTLLRSYCGKRDLDTALDVLEEMVQNGVLPNDVTYNTMIQGLCESENISMIIKDVVLSAENKKGGFEPDTCTFNTLVNALCSRGNVAAALRCFERAKDSRVDPDSATYSILIRALCRSGEFSAAEELLDELLEKETLLRNRGCVPLCAAYNPIFEHLCSCGKTRKADGVLRRLMRRGVQDPPAFETLILGHCKEGSFSDGHKLLVLMLRRDFKPHVDVYLFLIDGLLQKHEAKLAFDTVLKMLRSDYLPRASIFHRILMELIRGGSANESAELMMLMLEKGVRLNINLSTDVVRLLFEKGSKSEALELVRCVYGRGYVINIDELVSSYLCKETKNSRLEQAYELLVFLLRNDETAGMSSSLCDTVLFRLCEGKMLSEAFGLYYELLEKDFQGPFNCLIDLRNGLESVGKLKEAEFVSKRIPRGEEEEVRPVVTV
ncbi:hypothetical protein M569_06021 [Genlisea aurea]|uniref:Pentacotripeptide-repeat region of PRORP domain-containing protein n=1 Tax=Genlisea aurea TaxID=192259 RepID=S8CPR4_9LAMI|nr:hypothetical protein M569_06021 [Genlisea aurea]